MAIAPPIAPPERTDKPDFEDWPVVEKKPKAEEEPEQNPNKCHLIGSAGPLCGAHSTHGIYPFHHGATSTICPYCYLPRCLDCLEARSQAKERSIFFARGPVRVFVDDQEITVPPETVPEISPDRYRKVSPNPYRRERYG